MVNKTQAKLYKANSSYIISLKKSFVEDSCFPFGEGDKMDIVIDGDRIVLSKWKEEE